jgi:hypothetical protein
MEKLLLIWIVGGIASHLLYMLYLCIDMCLYKEFYAFEHCSRIVAAWRILKARWLDYPRLLLHYSLGPFAGAVYLLIIVFVLIEYLLDL